LIVETGIYRYIRHPLYASLVLLGFGIFFKNITWMTAVCAVINLLALAATAKTEEGEMLQKFGDGYARYRKKRKMFIPFVV
jgi:protein-S-isoprenylcysteine O-methyltransferase Ste14